MTESIIFYANNIPTTIQVDSTWEIEQKKAYLLDRLIANTQAFVDFINSHGEKYTYPNPQHYQTMVDVALEEGRCQLERKWIEGLE